MSISTIQEAVRTQYGAVARSNLTNDSAGVRAVAEAFGYSEGDLAGIPAEANMGLSCGNPIASASLRPGEVVVDLGSGGGLDVFLAAQRVGPTGRAIGIDMTPAMIDRARDAAAKGINGKPIENVEFHLASIDKLPLADASVDCVISNCVINLAEDKQAVFHEIARVLKPGGRLAVSDIALKQALPAELADSISGYVGCISGAIAIADYQSGLKAAGFAHVQVIDSGADLNAYAKVENQSGCCSPAMVESTAVAATADGTAAPRVRSLQLAKTGCCSGEKPVGAAESGVHTGLAELLTKYDVNAYAASVKIFATKPVV
ncbi:arsenite methyltransferase [Humisphaera borealis]|uniref:Arsenite methyltransferase n=1 Tax=Humisphaera borealis TaxID=2807512 RepID=A0A7M2WT83_9BACT|nr:arsenite methyltransferase [Humisphaera borealis]QOV88676.1 arsenite methyltransferase [Humisphaera borealis]